MHVFFDDQIFVTQTEGGISRYFVDLARALSQGKIQVHLFAGISRNLYLQQLQPGSSLSTCFLRRRDSLRINTTVAKISRLWRRLHFARLRHRAGPVLYHATNYAVDPWISRRAAGTCMTVFDMIAELMCDEGSRQRSLSVKRDGLASADAIVCISEQTRRDFLQFFPECSTRAHVTHLAAELAPPTRATAASAQQSSPYFLMVGKRHGYKNGLVAWRAFAILATEHPSVRLVCFGGEPFSAEERTLLREFGLQDRVIAIQGSDDLLAAYYAHGRALLYPSRYEGFGLPVLEAMQMGCPVVTTRCASLPEVAGTAALYVDPEDAKASVQAAARLLDDEPRRQDAVQAGRAQCAQFSWQKTAAQTRSVYEQMLGRKQMNG